MTKRILITGPSGIGKTTLAEEISKKYQLPFLKVSMIKDIVPRYNLGLKTHSEVIELSKENVELGFSLQWDLLMKRQIMYGEYYGNGFVTDRGHIDSMVYTWSQIIEPHAEYVDIQDKWKAIQKKSISIHRLFTHIIFLPWSQNWRLEDNGIRVYDPGYQNRTSLLYANILKTVLNISLAEMKSGEIYDSEGLLPYILMLDELDFDKRIEQSVKFIEEYD